MRLIEPGADTFKLIAQAGLTASVASTGCMEAGVMGYPAITFARVFYAPVLVADAVNPFALTLSSMADLLDRACAFRDAPGRAAKVEAFITWCVAQSCDGLISDPVSDPVCMEASNISSVARATREMMQATAALGTLQKGRLR